MNYVDDFLHILTVNVLKNYSDYPPVNPHSNGNAPFPIGNTFTNGGCSIAMLVYRSVYNRMMT